MRPAPPALALLLAPLVLAALPFAPPATAAESYDSCKYTITSLPAVLSSPGTWCLKGDLATAIASGTAVTIAANSVTLDCNGFRIGGQAAGTGTTANGILVSGRSNVVIRGCVVRGFRRGATVQYSYSTVVEDSVFDASTQIGVYLLESYGNIVRRNRISDTGGSSAADTSSAWAVYAYQGDFDIEDTLIDGVYPAEGIANGNVRAIETYNGRGTISDNRIRNLSPTGTGNGHGIFNDASLRIAIERNVIDLSGVTNGTGIYCANNNSIAANNRLLDTPTGIGNCATLGNFVDTD